jgi:hypothetical protein
MKERDKRNQSMKQEECLHHLPPAWCGSVCRNAMSEVCIEECAIKRDCSGFDAKPNLKITDMPRFPKTEGMSKEERFTSVTIYLSKVVDHIQGVEHGETFIQFPRPYPYRAGSRKVSENLEVKDLLPGVQAGNPSSKNRSQRQDPPDGSSEMDGRAGQAT